MLIAPGLEGAVEWALTARKSAKRARRCCANRWSGPNRYFLATYGAFLMESMAEEIPEFKPAPSQEELEKLLHLPAQKQ